MEQEKIKLNEDLEQAIKRQKEELEMQQIQYFQVHTILFSSPLQIMYRYT